MFSYCSADDFALKNYLHSRNDDVNYVFNLLFRLRVFGRVRWRRPTVTHRDLNASSEDANHQWGKTLGNKVCCVSVRFQSREYKECQQETISVTLLAAGRLSRNYDRARESDSHHEGDSCGSCKFVCILSFNFPCILLTRGLAVSAFQRIFEKELFTLILKVCF